MIFFAVPYLSRFGLGKSTTPILVWVVIANLFSKRPAPKTTTSHFDKVAMYLLGAFLVIAFLDYKFHVVNKIYELYLLSILK